ncbi:hypothetical protein SORBI_3002G431200 [Sorghum bicolor]|uniref:Uncharacterized protein n=1 Tax=Sorghum bicolor TaxID=4558 RepID=A0A1B6QGJ2_SORBI|nr:hypothetical protein SORBI_3002G431200 [Sorghum bicolor]
MWSTPAMADLRRGGTPMWAGPCDSRCSDTGAYLSPCSSPRPLPLPSLYPWRRGRGPCAAPARVMAPPMRASTLSTIPSSLDLDTPAWPGPATAAAPTQVLTELGKDVMCQQILDLTGFVIWCQLGLAS